MDNFTANSKLHKLTFIKTILMLCVIAGHSVNFWTGNWFTTVVPVFDSKFLCYISDFLSSFHVFAFTLVSGYLFYYLKIEQEKYKEFLPFIKGKVLRLIVPYIFVCIVWAIPIAEYFFQYSLGEIIRLYALGTNPNQLWFLLMLFWVYAIAWPLAGGVFDKRPLSGAVIVGGLYAVGIVGSRLVPNYFYFWTGCEYILFFWIGFMMRKLPDFFGRIKWYVWLGGFIIFLVAREWIDGGVVHSLLEIAVHIFGAVAAFETLNALADKENLEEKGWFSGLSSKSMPIYLFHQQIIYFTIFWLNGKVNPYLNAGLNFVIAITGSIMISTILMRWKITRFLIGEK